MGKKLKISKELNSIIIINNDTHLFYKIDNIVSIKSDREYIRVYQPNESDLILGTLNTIIKELPDYFIKPHRSYILNIKKIKEIKFISKRKCSAIMTNNMAIPLTKSALTKIKSFFV